MNYVIIFNIVNQKEEYVKVAEKIERILHLEENLDGFKIVETSNKNLPANKLEEPLDGVNISSSFRDVNSDKYSYIIKKFNKKIRFHIRVTFKNESYICLESFHYLALLVSKFAYLVKEKRLSLFLIPRTSNVYPFCKNGQTDIELYHIASMHLRAFIGDINQGIIYGVSKPKFNNNNIVKALDFSILAKGDQYFPIILFDGNISHDEKNEDLYINSIKKGNASQRNIDLKNVNNYSLIFNKNVLPLYLSLAKQLNARQRFGLSTHKNPNIALCDYVFETSYNLLKKKAEAIDISLAELLCFLKNELEKTNIFTFALFSFILNVRETEICSAINLKNKFRNTYFLSCKISSGIEQIVQNALQHSSNKTCILSFFKNEESLKIIVSDLSEFSIIKTFNKNLEAEEKHLSEIISTYDFSELSSNLIHFSRSNFYLSKKSITLNCFFNDFAEDKKDTEVLKNWLSFRRTDSSAHIGMALFSNAIKRCGGSFSLVSCSNYKLEEGDKSLFYTTEKYRDNGDFYHFPGTEYNITLPTEFTYKEKSSNIVQLNNTNYKENYDSFAAFLDYKIQKVEYSPDKEKLNQAYLIVKKININDALQKFSLQIMWTNYWLSIFNKINIEPKSIIRIDYNDLGFKKNFLENNHANETIIKGLIDSISIFSSKNSNNDIYIALINVEPIFLNLFEEISVSLSLKSFPPNLQIFISDKYEESQIQLFGHCYGQAIKNAYSLSLENYYKSYDGAVYYDVNSIMIPFAEVSNDESTNLVNVCPFSGILQSNFGDRNMFFSKIKNLAQKNLICENGYKLIDNHTRLGNKVHIDSFYEMSHLFHRTMVANHVAFYIIGELIKNTKVNICTDNILFYGYASYSQAILMSLTKILEAYRDNKEHHNENSILSYSIYQYNLQHESDPQNIKIYLSNPNLTKNSSDIKIIQIVPISSTLTTFAKMWNKLNNEYNKNNNLNLCENFTVFLVRDVDGTANKASSMEEKYFKIDNGKIECNFDSLNNAKKINYIITGETRHNFLVF